MSYESPPNIIMNNYFTITVKQKYVGVKLQNKSYILHYVLLWQHKVMINYGIWVINVIRDTLAQAAQISLRYYQIYVIKDT